MRKAVVPGSEVANEVQLVAATRAAVVVSVAGQEKKLAWPELRVAARQEDREIAGLYQRILHAALFRRAVSDLYASVAACPGHRAQGETRRVAFGGPVSRDERPSAWGGVTLVETCYCGARRKANVNGRHVEQGGWHVDEAAAHEAIAIVDSHGLLTARDQFGSWVRQEHGTDDR